MELLAELLVPIEEQSGFFRSKIDMTLLGWVVMFLCLCLHGVNCALVGEQSSSENLKYGKSKTDKDRTMGSVCLISRWDSIQGESVLYWRITNPKSTSSVSGFTRRLQKKIIATKQKLEELDSVAAGLGYNTNNPEVIQRDLASQFSALGTASEKSISHYNLHTTGVEWVVYCECLQKLSNKIVTVAQTLMLCLQKLGVVSFEAGRHIQLALPGQLKSLHSHRTT
ncbi:unnamed protein product [Allacma fusca]|uniref:Uncharacterized protein n=1 Tax=Allacma fusca TaxID=39272 RepID=A0A8J2NTR3_9HEXA|nr:unnamed protein product [Allacma fusca]